MKWYQKTWVIILFLIFFFPVGLFLMWRYSNWNKVVKGIVTGLFCILIITNISGGNKEIETNSTKNIEDSKEVQIEKETNTENKKENDSRFIVKEENTSSAVDELVLRAKENSKNATEDEIKEAVKFINDNYNNYWTDNETMHKGMYYGAFLEYAKHDANTENLGMDTVQVIKYIYRGADKIEDDSTQANLRQIEKSLKNISNDLK